MAVFNYGGTSDIFQRYLQKYQPRAELLQKGIAERGKVVSQFMETEKEKRAKAIPEYEEFISKVQAGEEVTPAEKARAAEVYKTWIAKKDMPDFRDMYTSSPLFGEAERLKERLEGLKTKQGQMEALQEMAPGMTSGEARLEMALSRPSIEGQVEQAVSGLENLAPDMDYRMQQAAKDLEIQRGRESQIGKDLLTDIEKQRQGLQTDIGYREQEALEKVKGLAIPLEVELRGLENQPDIVQRMNPKINNRIDFLKSRLNDMYNNPYAYMNTASIIDLEDLERRAKALDFLGG